MPCFLGCENAQEATVAGLVTLDGEPLVRGSVRFIAGSKNESKAGEGGIQPDGTYKVQIGQSGKLYIGEYQVEVASRGPATPHPEGGPPTPGNLITPEHYRDIDTSGLCYNIRPGENTIDIALVSDPVETSVEDSVDSEELADEVADAIPEEESAENTNKETTK